jgi:hypothetical protein
MPRYYLINYYVIIIINLFFTKITINPLSTKLYIIETPFSWELNSWLKNWENNIKNIVNGIVAYNYIFFKYYGKWLTPYLVLTICLHKFIPPYITLQHHLFKSDLFKSEIMTQCRSSTLSFPKTLVYTHRPIVNSDNFVRLFNSFLQNLFCNLIICF